MWLTRYRRGAPERLAAALGLLVLVVASTIYLSVSWRRTYRLTITAGSAAGLRHQVALRLKIAAARRGVVLNVIESRGSEDALDGVNAGAVDLALVQGGIDLRDRHAVKQAATLRIEPLHLLVKAEIEPNADEARGLELLRGRTVNLSEPGSGTYDLALEVLAFAGLRPGVGDVPGGFKPTRLSYSQLLEQTDRDKLPDAMFTVSALPSPVARHLIQSRGFRLVPLRFGEAFELDVANAAQAPGPARNLVERGHVFNTVIPAYTYGVSPPLPPQPVPTFGTRLLLVAAEGVSPTAVSRVLEAGRAIGPGGPVIDEALDDLPPEYDWHAGAFAFRERNKPLFFGDAIDLLEKGTSLTGGLLGGLFFLWQWRRQRTRRRHDLRFESYILKVAVVESEALKLETSAEPDLKELIHLQTELGRLKSEALRKYAEGELGGEELMSGFVAHVNDARSYLNRLILYRRERLEKEAVRQQRPVAAAWSEAMGEIDLDRHVAPEPAASGS